MNTTKPFAGMSEKYNATCVRLVQLLNETPGKWDTACVLMDRNYSISPNDCFREKNPDFGTLVQKVNDEFQYEMSDWQCSWAVLTFASGLAAAGVVTRETDGSVK